MASEWQTLTLADLGRIVTGKTPPTKEPANFGGKVPFVSPRDMDGERFIRVTERNLTPHGVARVKNAVLPPHSVLVSCIGSDMGKAAITPVECVTNQQINSIIVAPEFDYRFVYYSLSTRKDEIRGLAGGSAQPILNKSDFGQIEIKLPELDAQKKISQFLSTLDDKIELNRQINTTLESITQALFKSWFVDFDPVIDNMLAAGKPIPEALQAKAQRRAALGAQRHTLPSDIQQLFPSNLVFTEELGWVPEGWGVADLGAVSRCFDSKRIPLSKKQREDKKPGAIPYYGATSVMDYINEWVFDGVYLLVGEDGSVIKDDNTPFTQYIWGRSWVNNHAHVLQGAAGVTTEHLMLFMKAQNMSAYVTGAVQLKINQKNLNSIPFLKAAEDVNRYFGDLLAPIFHRYRELCEQNSVLSELRDTLLPKLLSGQLRIPEAEQQATEVV